MFETYRKYHSRGYTLEQERKLTKLKSQLSRAKLSKDKHLVASIEKEILNISIYRLW